MILALTHYYTGISLSFILINFLEDSPNSFVYCLDIDSLSQEESEKASISYITCRISSIESKASHPMATALIAFAKAHEIEPKPDEVENFQNFPGEGIFGSIEGNDIYIGNWKVASRARCSTSE